MRSSHKKWRLCEMGIAACSRARLGERMGVREQGALAGKTMAVDGHEGGGGEHAGMNRARALGYFSGAR